jgi:hypothetical protein
MSKLGKLFEILMYLLLLQQIRLDRLAGLRSDQIALSNHVYAFWTGRIESSLVCLRHHQAPVRRLRLVFIITEHQLGLQGNQMRRVLISSVNELEHLGRHQVFLNGLILHQKLALLIELLSIVCKFSKLELRRSQVLR